METARTEAMLTLHLSPDVAAEMERSAYEQETDVSTLLTKSYRVYKALQLREYLQRMRPEHVSALPQKTQEEIETYVDEVRAEIFSDRGFLTRVSGFRPSCTKVSLLTLSLRRSAARTGS